MTRKPIKLPDQKTLRRYFDFDQSTGHLIWRHRDDKRPQWNGRFAGNVAGSATHRHGYWVINLDGYGPLLAHRIIWKWLYNSEPETVDHINGDRADNRPRNLRAASFTQNMRNKSPHAGKLLPKGVSRVNSGGRFRASIYLEGKCRHLGTFESAEAAHEAYSVAARQAFGEFARLSEVA